MKSIFKIITILLIAGASLQAQDAKEIVKKANDKMNGEETSISTMNMTIVRPTWQRTITFKNWQMGTKYALTLITAPAKDKGQAFLKRNNEMWNWDPNINRMIKMPPSMLSQGWMGSDVTNDDIINDATIVADYTHKLLGKETVSGKECFKIELLPIAENNPAWGKMIIWITTDGEYNMMKTEYYDEESYLIRTETAYDLKDMNGRIIPARIEIVPAEEPENKTILEITNIQFNVPLQESFFSQQNLKRVR